MPPDATSKPALSLVVHAGGFDRVHYAFVMAAAAAAIGRPVVMFLTGRAVRVALAAADGFLPGWHGLDPAADGAPPSARDHAIRARGGADLETLIEAVASLDVRVIVCELALTTESLTEAPLRPDLAIERAGVATYLEATPTGAISLFI